MGFHLLLDLWEAQTSCYAQSFQPQHKTLDSFLSHH